MPDEAQLLQDARTLLVRAAAMNKDDGIASRGNSRPPLLPGSPGFAECKEAIGLCRQVLKINPRLDSAHVMLTFILGRMNDHDAALAAATEYAAQCDPDDPATALVLCNLGIQLSISRKATERLKGQDMFRKAVELAPNDPSMRYNLGTSFHREGKVLAAMEHFEAALCLTGKTPIIVFFRADCLCNYGDCLALTGDANGAVKTYQQALTIEPRHAMARDHMAALKVSTSMEAIKTMTMAELDRKMAPTGLGGSGFDNEIMQMSLKRMKQILAQDNIRFAHCIEKAEFRVLVAFTMKREMLFGLALMAQTNASKAGLADGGAFEMLLVDRVKRQWNDDGIGAVVDAKTNAPGCSVGRNVLASTRAPLTLDQDGNEMEIADLD